ncbi:hypothetical protein MLD38_017732 [Melastoma candidum]|uniref:Uncharacterized protein n=1 Tax=Melastoma candidum TaxID=119954 RepID=A0ACB9QSX4_9MYRT|nr:hypothetical protein MLD38_017732 [Melastoma candidum]
MQTPPMAAFCRATIIFAVVGFFYVSCSVEALDTSRVLLLCNTEEIPSMWWQLRLGAVIIEVLAHTPNGTASNNYYTHWGPFQNISDIYSHGECTPTLSDDDCKSCMNEAYHQLFYGCERKIAAQIQLKDCRLRYELYEFTDNM